MLILGSCKQKHLSKRRINTLFIMLACLFLYAKPSTANEWISIAAGHFLMGSSTAQIESGYQISQQGYGHDGVREAHWFDHEAPQHRQYLAPFQIMKTPVTQAEYAQFIQETHHKAPFVRPKTWANYHLAHPYSHVLPYLWQGNTYPKGKANHPVVLVNIADIAAYVAWLSKKTGQSLRLPSHAEWEKAMRGTDGRLFPWGNDYHADYLNNADHGAYATVPVGSFPQAASPYGVLDGAGQVFEWTATSLDHGEHYIVKGGSWDDHGGVCRPAAFHTRPAALKHILVGFRLIRH